MEAVFDGWKGLGEAFVAGAIAGDRTGQIQRFMRAVEVIDFPPAVEALLTVLHIGIDLGSDGFSGQGAVESFEFALGLGMGWPAMADIYAQPHEPDGQLSMADPGAA